MANLSIYWGVLFDFKRYLPHANIAVVDFDGLELFTGYEPTVGPFIKVALEAEIASRPDHLGFMFVNPEKFDNNPMKVRLAVLNQEYWGAVIINPYATAFHVQAVEQDNACYDPFGATSVVYDQARDIESCNFDIVPALDRLAMSVTRSFGSSWASKVFTNQSSNVSTYLQHSSYVGCLTLWEWQLWA